MRSARHKTLALAVVAAIAISLSIGTASAVAAPTVGFPMEPGAGLDVHQLTQGPVGSVWYARVVDESPTVKSKIGRIDANGAIVTPEIEVDGKPVLTTANDQGVWISDEEADTITHITASGTPTTFALPWPAESWEKSPVVGLDGAFWGIWCRDFFKCFAIKTTLAEGVRSFQLPPIGSAGFSLFPVSSGIWVQTVRSTGTPGKDPGPLVAETGFLKYNGQMTLVTTEKHKFIVGAAPDDQAWQTYGYSWAFKVGLLGQSGVEKGVRGFFSGPRTFFDARFAPGPNKTLNWSVPTSEYNVNPATTGTFSLSGDTAIEVPFGATAVPPPNANSATEWSMEDNFGEEIVSGDSGGKWFLSSGKPWRVTALSPMGKFSTFPPIEALRGSRSDYQLTELTESNDGYVWFAVNTPEGAHYIVRGEQSSPPAGYVYTGPKQKAAAQSELREILRATRAAIAKKRRAGRSLKVPMGFPRDGSASIKAVISANGQSSTLLTGSFSRSYGKATKTFRLTRSGMRILFSAKNPRLKLSVRFSAPDREPVVEILKSRVQDKTW